MSFYITDYGTPKIVGDKLLKSGAAAVDLMNPMSKILLNMIEIEKEIFKSNGRRGGGSWKALKSGTVDKKGNTQILRTEGSYPGYPSGQNLLFRSLTEVGAPFQIMELKRDGLEFGTSRPYAFTHQRGSAKRGIPKRPFLKFTKTDSAKWEEILLRHILEAVATPTVPKV